jgi:hypothetical protein
MLCFDHIVIAVSDVENAAQRYRDEHGLRFQPGGIHPGGTKNWANLFPDGSYIELLAVHDPTLPYAALIARYLERHGDGLWHWALRTDSIDAVASRTGVAPTGGSIDSLNGERQASWRIVSHPEPRRAGVGLPFFIEYETDRRDVSVEQRRSRARAMGIELTEGRIEWVEVGADANTLSAWVGSDELDIRISDGTRGLQRVGLSVDGRDAVLD